MRIVTRHAFPVAVAATVVAALNAPSAVAMPSSLPSTSVMSSQAGLPIPGELLPGDSVENRLLDATKRNLERMGYHESGVASVIAHAWLVEAAVGQVDFIAGAGNGSSGLPHRTNGNIYRFTVEEAEQHIEWLSREVNEAPDHLGFGLAVARIGDMVYLAEIFELN